MRTYNWRDVDYLVTGLQVYSSTFQATVNLPIRIASIVKVSTKSQG